MIHKKSDEGAKVSVNAETAGERAYRRIRRDILFGGLAPAQKLKLDGLKAGKDWRDLEAAWRDDVEAFRKRRGAVLLYPE